MSEEVSGGEALLLRYHARHTGATSYTFADARDQTGRSSYQWLVDDAAASGGRRVLDLACGDGYLLERLVAPGRSLTGVDMSAAELDAARRRLEDAATLVQARAAALPFADAAFDAVVSHLALMLMERLDAVVAEIARVLAPGGWCFAVVGGRGDDPPSPELRCFRDAWLATIQRTGHTLPAIGDQRASTEEGLAALFAANGFGECSIERIVIRRPGSAHQVAEHYGLFYPPASLPDGERDRFIDALTDALVELERKGSELAVVATVVHLRARRPG